MRNTSDPIKKENSNVMNAQGGEKKVMKKILSVALSTAMAFSMFASVAFGDTAVSPQQQFDALKAKGIFNGYPDGTAGLDKDMTRAEFAKVITKLLGLKEITGTLSYTDKNYTAKNWAVPYIEAVTAAGIMEGKNVEKKIFDFNGKVTVSEMATILTRALDLEIPAETNNTAPAWAKGYVQAAINAGLVDANTNFTANASRELLVGAAYAIDEAQSLKVTSYTVTEGGKVVEFKISDGETVKVTLDKALEANKETEVKFTYKEKSFTEKVTYVVEAATKVQSATSTNLKEVEVAFDGKVDKATATDKANYTVDSNSKGIKSITLLADGKTARLLLNESSQFTQGTTYKVVVKNVKSSTGTVVPQGEVSFTSSDNVLPTVTEVKALGTKVIKVTFSEPVKSPTSSNFQLDEKAFVGSVTHGANQREVILRDYTGSISEGAHKLTTSLIEDYAGLKSLAATTDFTVAADTEGPKVTEVSATLEKVTVTFDEEIDPQSVSNESFYWKSGDTKKVGKATQISGNVYEVDFTENRLPGYETTLFVEVKDYSGNANATKEHKVTASVDLVQPRVLETTYGPTVEGLRLTVRFDKSVTAADAKYYTVKKGNDVIPVKSVKAAGGSDNKVFYVEFYSTDLKGTHSLKVADVQDTTALRNTLVTYEGTFVASDSQAPQLETFGIDANNDTRRVALTFDKEVDLATLNNRANYYYTFKKDNSTAQKLSLPNDVQINVDNSGKSVILVFPQTIDGTTIKFGGAESVQAINIVGLKAKANQVVGGVDAPLAVADLTLNSVVLKDAKTVEVTFNKAISNATRNDFTLNGEIPSTVTVKDNVVTLKSTSDLSGAVDVETVRNNSIQSYAGYKIGYVIETPVGVVAPRVDESALPSNKVIVQTGKKFVIPFTEQLETANQASVATDLVIKKLGEENTPKLDPINEYQTTVEGKNVIVTIDPSVTYSQEFSVQVKDEGATFIRTVGTDKKAAKSSVYKTTANEAAQPTGVNTTAPAATTTHGAAQVEGEKQVVELPVTGDITTGGTVVVNGTVNGTPINQSVTVAAGDDSAAVAQEIADALIISGFDVTTTGTKVVITSSQKEANKTVTLSLANGSAVGLTTTNATTVTEGIQSVTGVAQIVTVQVTGATRDGSNKVTFTDGTNTVVKTITVKAGDSAGVVAAKISDVLAGQLNGFTVSSSSNEVKFTATAQATDKPVQVTISAN
ncbi:S-layer homology domain-containing protein [Paenibacillus amylolyticus]|uniref:S-layer homology domain-containing protein n=1 Tax=Paenibacillus amylolyticus TaxID=1451 RepID=UPI003242B312